MMPIQQSLIPLFGEIESPEASKFNAAFDAWNSQFGQFATLQRFTANMTASEQSWQQKELLIAYVSMAGHFQKLLAVDFGFSALNTAFRNYVWAAHISAYDRELKTQREQQKLASAKFNAQLESEAEAKKSSEQKMKNLLESLELKEQLLAIEKEYPTVKAAENSTYCKRANSIPDIRPVITLQKRWIGTQQYDDRGERIGHHEHFYVLTFESIEEVAA